MNKLFCASYMTICNNTFVRHMCDNANSNKSRLVSALQKSKVKRTSASLNINVSHMIDKSRQKQAELLTLKQSMQRRQELANKDQADDETDVLGKQQSTSLSITL